MNKGLNILFDFDGVLVEKVNFAQLAHQNFGINTEGLSAFFQTHLQACLIGEADMIQLFSENAAYLKWEASSESLFRAIYVESQVFNNELIGFIQSEIQPQHNIHLATNQDVHRFNHIRQDPLISSFCDQLICSCELGVAKPDIEFFEKAFAVLQCQDNTLNKANILFVDDLAENVDSAEIFGFESHMYTSFEAFKSWLKKRESGKKFPRLENDLSSLRKMALRDAAAYSAILSEANTYHFLTESGPIDEKNALQKIISNRNAFDEGRSIYWSIAGKANEFLGFIALHGYTQEQVAISYGIHPAHRRKGIATAAVNTLLNWEGLKEKKVQLATHKANIASYHMLSKMNLKYQGIQLTKFGERHIFTN